MNKFLIALGSAFLVTSLLMVFPLLGTLAGLVVGWIVGWFFSQTILGVFAAFGVTGIKMWQLGAFLGFIGGFFRGISANKS